MKKMWIAIAAALLVVIGLVLFVPSRQSSPTAEDLAEYMPQDALLVLSLTNLNTVTDNFAASPLGQFFAKDTMHAILADMDATPDTIQAYDQWFDNIANTMKHPVFRTVFGDDLTMALLPPDTQLLSENPEQALRRAVLVYATTNAGAAAELFGGMAKGITVSKEQTDGLELTRIQVDNGREIFYGYNAGGLVLLAQDKVPLVAAIQTKESDTSLKTQASYLEATDFWRKESTPSDTYSRAYYNLAGITALLARLDQDQDIQDIASYLQGMDYGYDVTGKTTKGVQNKSRIKLRYEQLHDVFKAMVDAAATDGPAPLALLNEHTLFFQWGYSLKPETLLALMATEDQEEYASLQQEAQDILGIPLEDAAASFGPLYGLVLNDIVETGIFPLPDITVFASVRNRTNMISIATALDQQMTTAIGLAGQEQQLAGNTQLYSWPVMGDIGLVPALGLSDNFVLLGSMQSSVQPLLTSLNQSTAELPAALAEQLGPELSKKFGQANSGVYLLRSARLAGKSQSTLELLNSLAVPTTGMSFNRFSQEMVKLMQATDLVAGASSISKGSAHWNWDTETVWVKAAAPQAEGTTPAGSAQ